MTPHNQMDNELVRYLMEIKEDTSQIKENQLRLRDELFSENGHITRINEHIAKQDTRYWITTALIAPVIGIVHLVLRKIGVDV